MNIQWINDTESEQLEALDNIWYQNFITENLFIV